MEVHHHPTAIGSHSQRRKWTHYFREFLMLFLAVFCGFLAEYKLEHTIEHNREKQYVQSYLEDVKADTAVLHGAIELRSRRVNICDSLIVLLKSSDREQFTSIIYMYGLRLSSSNRFSPFDRTIHQLRNAGGMRLIRAEGASDSIMTYDIGLRRMQLDEDQSLEILNQYRIAAGKVFDAAVFLKMEIMRDSAFRLKKPDDGTKLLTTAAGDINNLCMQLLFYRRSNEAIKNSLIRLSARAERLIQHLEEAYDLK
jgi:hypothetical protein